MSFNKNNPNAMGKIMGYLRQLSTEMAGNEQGRQRPADEERLYRPRGPKYSRVPSRNNLSASTTCTSLATSCGSQGNLAPNYAVIPEHTTTESSSEDEQDSFEDTRRHFQQLRQISLGNEFKYKMEMEIKSAKDENLRNSVPYVKQLSTDDTKVKADYAINGDAVPYTSTTQRIFIWTQILAAFSVSLGSMIVGFSSGYSSPAGPKMENDTSLNMSEEEKTWVGSLMPLAAIVGAAFGGPLIDLIGRKRIIIATAIPFAIGYLLIANAVHTIMILVGRVLCGICVGVNNLAFPLYLGETTQPEVRGALGLLPTAFGNIGILVAYAAGAPLSWSGLAFLGAGLSVPFFLMMLLTPETPRWYVTKGRVGEARKSLQWLRGKNNNVDKELDELTLTQAETNHAGGSMLRQLFSARYVKTLLIAFGLMFFQQLSGINAIIFNAKDIFKMAGSTIDENVSSIIIGVVNFVSTFIATALIDRLGRKILLYISIVSMVITLVALGSYCYVKDSGVNVGSLGWLPLACLVIYVLGFSVGFGPIPWLMLGEILPSKVRGTAAAMATCFNWACAFIVTKTFEDIQKAIHLYGAAWMFSVICIVALFFVIFFVPETRGKSLEELERILTGSKKPRNINTSKHLQNGC